MCFIWTPTTQPTYVQQAEGGIRLQLVSNPMNPHGQNRVKEWKFMNPYGV